MAANPKPDNPVEDLAFERGIDICQVTVRTWVYRFGPMFAAEIRKRRLNGMRQHTHVCELARRENLVAR